MFDPTYHLLVRYLDLSGSSQPPLENLHYMGYLHFLNISSCGMKNVSDQELMFDPADHLHVRYLDLSGSFQPPLETLHYMGFLHFLNLSSCSLSSVSLDSLETVDCRTLIDELSSCNDLLRSDFFRGFLWALSSMAISGNIGVLIYRVFLETQGSSSGFRVLVANLCVADSLMGVYLVITGSADVYYSGQYIWKREAWTRSRLCQTAGFLALMSSELSAFVICLITVDRLLVLQFPLHRHLHLSTRSAMMTCCAAWFIGLVLAAVPLIPAEWTFYGQTGICLPLPITRKPFLGQHYAFGVFVILNFLLFVLIGVGQLLIYHAVRKSSMASRSNRRKQDVAIARRLSLIVFTDFCCWFPIGLMGLLAFRDTPIPGEVNVWAAIFILPVNSAINPFLYTLSMLVERWLKRREEKRLEKTLARLHADMITWSDTKVQELLTHS
nr:hypothetical protein BaRGS_011613 [Batillaria attramentaria]